MPLLTWPHCPHPPPLTPLFRQAPWLADAPQPPPYTSGAYTSTAASPSLGCSLACDAEPSVCAAARLGLPAHPSVSLLTTNPHEGPSTFADPATGAFPAQARCAQQAPGAKLPQLRLLLVWARLLPTCQPSAMPCTLTYARAPRRSAPDSPAYPKCACPCRRSPPWPGLCSKCARQQQRAARQAAKGRQQQPVGAPAAKALPIVDPQRRPCRWH